MKAISKAKSVCFITETNGFGGVEVHTLNLIKLLSSEGYNIELICCRHNVYDDKILSLGIDGVKPIYTQITVNNEGATAIKQWLSLLRQLHSDIMIFPKGCNALGSIAFLITCRRHFRKVYYIEHQEADRMPPKTSKKYLGGLIKGLCIWWYRKRFRRKRRSFYADRIVAVSEAVRQSLIQHCWYSARKVQCVPNGIFWQEFERANKLGANFRRKYDIPKKAIVFGMLTRLSYEKGTDIALKAFHLLNREPEKEPSYMVIIGDGRNGKELRNFASDLKLDKRTLFTGFMEKPIEAISAVDFILFPSRKEGLPLALLESMAAGCIPIVSRVSAMPEVVNSHEIGWVTEPESVKELYKAMKDALALDELTISKRRMNAINRIKSHYDAEQTYINILHSFEMSL